MRLLCRLGWHRYGTWSSFYLSTRKREGFMGAYFVLGRFRALKCLSCGHIHEQHFGQWASNQGMGSRDGLREAIWPDESNGVSRLSDEMETRFEDDVLDKLWKEDPNGPIYQLANDVFCAARGVPPGNRNWTPVDPKLKEQLHVGSHKRFQG